MTIVRSSGALVDSVAVNWVYGVAAPSVIAMFASEASSSGALARIRMSAVGDGGVATTPDESLNFSGSVENLTALVSPGMQPAARSTSGENVSPQSLPVGYASTATSTMAGPSASNPPWAGFSWLPDGVQ